MDVSKEYMEYIFKSIKKNNFFAGLKNKRILITGASGLICSTVVDFFIELNEKLHYNIEIYAAGRNYKKMEKRFGKYFQRHYFCFVNYDALKIANFSFKVDYIINGAGIASPNLYKSYPVETLLSNVYGLNNILNFAKNNLVEKVLYISSSEVYGEMNLKNDSLNSLSEKDYGYIDILNSRSSYSEGKRLSETLCISYFDEYNIDTVIARPAYIYGPNFTSSDQRVYVQFSKNALKKEDIVLKSAGLQLRSYCHCIDCASALILILLNGNSGAAYNISDENSFITVKALAERFAKISGRKIVFENSTKSEKKGYSKIKDSTLSSRKLKDLGWKPIFSLDNGITETLNELLFRRTAKNEVTNKHKNTMF